MQSSHQIKKIHEYAIGEKVYEGDYYAGRVLSVAMQDSVMGYVLLINDSDEYTIYRGLSDANCSLILTRNIPEAVAMQFAQAILGGESLEVPNLEEMYGSRHVGSDEPARPVSEIASPNVSPDIVAPYFDFI